MTSGHTKFSRCELLRMQEVIEVKKDVRMLQAQLQVTLSEATSSESQLQQSRQELKTAEEKLFKLRAKVRDEHTHRSAPENLRRRGKLVARNGC